MSRLERFGEDGWDGFVFGHAHQKVNVIVFGDHILIASWLLTIHCAMHLVDDCDRLETDVELVCIDPTRLGVPCSHHKSWSPTVGSVV